VEGAGAGGAGVGVSTAGGFAVVSGVFFTVEALLAFAQETWTSQLASNFLQRRFLECSTFLYSYLRPENRASLLTWTRSAELLVLLAQGLWDLVFAGECSGLLHRMIGKGRCWLQQDYHYV
jgi:hypothetical protein